MRHDKQLLIDTLSLQAESTDIQAQHNIVQYVEEVTGFKATFDKAGNAYFIKGSTDVFPCFVAHLDQVHDVCINYSIKDQDGILYAITSDTGIIEQVGTGGDDLVGVYVCILALLDLPAVKVALFVDEEIGCVGSSRADLSFFSNCGFIGQADRAGNSDFISFTNGVQVTSDKMLKAIKPVLQDYGYSTARGSITDVGELVCSGVGISSFNISCGYYDAHMKTECVVIEDVKRLVSLLSDIVTRLQGKQYTIEVQHSPYGYSYGYGKGFDRWDAWKTPSKTASAISTEDGIYCDDCYSVLDSDSIECSYCGAEIENVIPW